MALTDLTTNERRALRGIVRHPGLPDREVASLIGMSPSSLVAARLELEREGYIKTLALPAVQRLGAEFLAVSYTHSDSLPLREGTVDGLEDAVRDTEVFSLALETNQCMFMQFSRSYTDARRNIESIERFYRANGNLSKGFTTCFFPFAMSRLINHFDHSRLVDRLLGEAGPGEAGPREAGPGEAWGPEPLFEGRRPVELSAVGRGVLLGILDHPELPNTELARKIGLSRMTIGKWRNAFLADGLLSMRRVPDLGRMGVELLVLTHGRFAKDLPRGLRHFMPELMGTMGPVVFAALGDDDILALSAFPSFTQYREANSVFMSKYNEHEMFASPPERVLFSVRAMRTVRSHAYGPLVRRLLAPRGS